MTTTPTDMSTFIADRRALARATEALGIAKERADTARTAFRNGLVGLAFRASRDQHDSAVDAWNRSARVHPLRQAVDEAEGMSLAFASVVEDLRTNLATTAMQAARLAVEADEAAAVVEAERIRSQAIADHRARQEAEAARIAARDREDEAERIRERAEAAEINADREARRTAVETSRADRDAAQVAHSLKASAEVAALLGSIP